MTMLRQFTWALLATGAMTLTACSEQVVEPNGSHTVGDALSAKGGNGKGGGGNKPKPPDGDPPAAWTTAQEIVYIRSVTKKGKTERQIVVASVGTADEVVLLGGETEVGNPAWSASGDAVLFYIWSESQQDRGVYAIRRDPVTNSASDPELLFAVVAGGLPAMSPDGSRIAYVDFGAVAGDIWVRERATDGSWGSPLNIDGNGPDIVGAYPSWASDSRRLVATNDRDLVVYDIDPDENGHIDEISAVTITAGGPLEGQIIGGESSWARTTDQVVFGNVPGLWIIDFNDPEYINTCLLLEGNGGQPSWSPNDTKIVYQDGVIGDIRVVSLHPTELQANGCPRVLSDDVLFANSSKCSGGSCQRVREPNWRRWP